MIEQVPFQASSQRLANYYPCRTGAAGVGVPLIDLGFFASLFSARFSSTSTRGMNDVADRAIANIEDNPSSISLLLNRSAAALPPGWAVERSFSS